MAGNNVQAPKPNAARNAAPKSTRNQPAPQAAPLQEEIVTTNTNDAWTSGWFTMDAPADTAVQVEKTFDIDVFMQAEIKFNADGIRLNSNGTPYLLAIKDNQGKAIHFSKKLLEDLMELRNVDDVADLKGTKVPKALVNVAVLYNSEEDTRGLVFIRKASGDGSFE